MVHNVLIPRGGRPGAEVLEPGLADRFYFWSGGSGRRYVFSVHSLAAVAHFRDMVVIAVRYDGPALVPVWIGEIDDPQGDERLADAALAERIDEVHIHLLPGDATERRAVIDDLLGTCS